MVFNLFILKLFSCPVRQLFPENLRIVPNIYWKGISKQGDFFTAIYLANNEYGLCFVIPDADWVNGELRELIEDILDTIPTVSP